MRRRSVFERLTWEHDIVSAPLPSSPSVQEDSEQEAIAILLALGGHQCHLCKKTLRESDGHTCCQIAYCPLCGEKAQDYTSLCPHLVLGHGRQKWDIYYYRALNNCRQAGHTPAKGMETTLQPPARKLPGQKRPGYPRWTAEQLQAAYPPDVRPHLTDLFGLSLRQSNCQLLAPVLLRVLKPDLRTACSDSYYHYTDLYYCREPVCALARAGAFLTQVQEGTQRLRTMPPEAFVRSSSPINV